MFYIVLENTKRHIKTYDYYAKSSYRASTHNQLQLDLMRKSLGKTLNIQGYGTNQIQQLVWSIEDIIYTNVSYFNPLHRYMNGHIIEVNESYEALWFKLNDTNVTKNNCKFKEIYSDLDRDYLCEVKGNIEKYQRKYSDLRDHKGIYRDFISSCKMKQSSDDKLRSNVADSIESATNVFNYIDTLIDSSLNDINYYKTQFENYLEERRTL